MTMNTFKDYAFTFGRYVADSFIGRFFLTYFTLHTIHYFTTLTHAQWCMDFSILGYFNTIISGHGPICYILLSVAHHAQSNIYQILPALFISSGIGYITKRTMPPKQDWQKKD